MELHACNLLILHWLFDLHQCMRKEEDLWVAEEDRDGAHRKEYLGSSVIMAVKVGKTGSEQFPQGVADSERYRRECPAERQIMPAFKLG